MKKKIIALLKNRDIINYIWVGIGQNISAVLQLVSLFILIKAVGHVGNGIIIVVQTYWFLVSDLLSLQTLPGVIKYLSDSIVAKRYDLAKQYIKIGYIIDLSVGVIAIIVGLLSISIISKLLDWNNEVVVILYIFTPVVIFKPALNGTSAAILRYLEHFKTLSKLNIAAGFLRLLLYSIVLLFSPNIFYFAFAEVFVEFVHFFSIFIISIIIAQKNTSLNGFSKVKISYQKEFIKFNIYNGLSLTSDLSLGHVSNLIVNRVLGFEIISIYRVFEKTIGIFTRVTAPISQIVYPKMVAFISENRFKKARIITIKYMLFVIGIGIIIFPIVFFTYDLWMRFFITEPKKYIIPFVLFYVFTFLIMGTDLIHLLNMSLGKVKEAMIISVVINVFYISILYWIISKYYLTGFILLKIIQLIIVVLVKIFIINKHTKLTKNN